MNVGFLPPEDGTGRGKGWFSFTIRPKAGLATGTQIRNIALIKFDANAPIATNQVDPHDASKGTDPTRECLLTIDANIPSAGMNSLPGTQPLNFSVSWTGSAGSGGSGIASYTVYVSSDGGVTYTPWLTDTRATAGIYSGVAGKRYSFYVAAKSNVGTVQQVTPQAASVSTVVQAPQGTGWRSAQLTTTANAGDGSRTGVSHSSWYLYYYKGTDNHLWCVYWTGAAWSQAALTTTANVDDWLTFYSGWNIVYFKGTDNHLWAVFYSGGWQQVKLRRRPLRNS